MGKRRDDLIGQRFGRLVVLGIGECDNRGGVRWRCECDCGNYKDINGYSLTSGATESCGCLRREKMREIKTIHGGYKTPLNRVWATMKQRCTNPGVPVYKNYGGRGIRYHPSFETFEGFLAGIPDGYAPGLELDRIDNDGNYEPGNLRWATRIEQMNNTRRSRRLLHPVTGKEVRIAELSREFNISIVLLHRRLEKGMSVADACYKPVRAMATPIDDSLARDIKRALWTMTPREVAEWYNVSISIVRNIQNGITHYKLNVD
ncbi:hypothetical protein EOM33_06860 [Candidatus Saccharibacteria bacterium]|nr:hypothetical protein [Candidatus Saccharibacteria bacterium]